MIKIEIDLHDDLPEILNKVLEVNDEAVEIIVPKGALITENALGIKLIKQMGQKRNINIVFNSEDPSEQFLLDNMQDNTSTETVDEMMPIITKEPRLMLKIPKINLPTFKGLAIKKSLVMGIALLCISVVIFISLKIVSELPQAYVKVIVNAEPLTKSFQVKVSSDVTTQDKNLQGKILKTTVELEKSADTTGEKITGEKATGKIYFYNKTDSEKKFKKGTTLTFEDSKDKTYKFKTLEEVTVPARAEQAPDPTTPEIITYVLGKKEANIEAEMVGDKYNIDKGESLEIEGSKSSEFTAETSTDLSGGSEETIQVVSKTDLDNLKTTVNTELMKKAESAVKDLATKGQKVIAGSEKYTTVSTEYSAEENDEETTLTLKTVMQVEALSYAASDLDKLADSIVEEFVPQGYTLSNKERVINTEILGNTEKTVLSNVEADLQITLKTYVVTDISEEMLKDQLKGVSIGEAQRILGSIRNVKTYEFNLTPNIPFFNKVPKDTSRITINIERN